jgi:hypothetical protein
VFFSGRQEGLAEEKTPMPVPNPNHHLWRNGRLWWVAFTVIYDGWRQERVRRSLSTADLKEARRRRDDLFQQYAVIPSAEVVALRAPLEEAAATIFSAEPAFVTDRRAMRNEESRV